MSNDGTKEQLLQFFASAYEKFLNPDKREEIKRNRIKRKSIVAKKYGF